MSVRLLAPGDEAAAEAFLAAHADTTTFLRSNLRAVGLGWSGRAFEGHWAARVGADGAIAGIACHAWNGMLLVEDADPAETARAAVAASGRAVAGLIGPRAMVTAARAALGLAGAPAALDDDEVLMTLALDALILPPRLADGTLVCRRALPWDAERLTEWRHDYSVEALHLPAGDATRARARAEVERSIQGDAMFVALHGEEVVAMSAFNGMLPDVVQIGGVYTPPARRGRGYAQAAVAGSLMFARALGVRRAVLFADRAHPSSTIAYRKIGFVEAGDHALVIFPS